MVRSQKTASFKYVTVEQDDSELVFVAGSQESDSTDAYRYDTDVHGQESNRMAGDDGFAEKKVNAPVGKPQEKAFDAYRETTLDDLDHEPMSKMQRAVLVGIAVLVVVFVAYVLFF